MIDDLSILFQGAEAWVVIVIAAAFFLWLFFQISLRMICYTPRDNPLPNWVKFFGFIMGLDLGIIFLSLLYLYDPNQFERVIDKSPAVAVIVGGLFASLLGLGMIGVLYFFVSWMED